MVERDSSKRTPLFPPYSARTHPVCSPKPSTITFNSLIAEFPANFDCVCVFIHHRLNIYNMLTTRAVSGAYLLGNRLISSLPYGIITFFYTFRKWEIYEFISFFRTFQFDSFRRISSICSTSAVHFWTLNDVNESLQSLHGP